MSSCNAGAKSTKSNPCDFSSSLRGAIVIDTISRNALIRRCCREGVYRIHRTAAARLRYAQHNRDRTFGFSESPLLMSAQVIGIGRLPVILMHSSIVL